VVNDKSHASAAPLLGKSQIYHTVEMAGGGGVSRVGLDGCGKSRHHRFSNPELSNQKKSQHRLCYLGQRKECDMGKYS
jgi:hypothetical protein